jgi:hypothetical protein
LLYFSLFEHSQVHLTRADIPCPTCGKLFKTMERLRRHELTHSSAEAWRCAACPRTFARKDKLLAHVRTKHAQ